MRVRESIRNEQNKKEGNRSLEKMMKEKEFKPQPKTAPKIKKG